MYTDFDYEWTRGQRFGDLTPYNTLPDITSLIITRQPLLTDSRSLHVATSSLIFSTYQKSRGEVKSTDYNAIDYEYNRLHINFGTKGYNFMIL